MGSSSRNVRIEHQGPQQSDALALPARQFRRERFQTFRRKPYEITHVADPAVDLLTRPTQMSGGQRGVVPRSEVRKQPAVLNHVAGAVPELADRVGGNPGTPDIDGALVRDDESDQGSEQCRLAAAARSYEHRGLAGCEAHRYAIQCDYGAV